MNTSAVYIVAAACIGYVFCFNCYKFKYSLARKAGYYAYLHCTSFGLIFVSLGFLMDWHLFHADWASKFAVADFRFSNKVFRDIASSVVISVLSLQLFNLFIDKPKAVALAWKDDLSSLLWKAMELDLPVQVTMETRKVYVGQVFDTPAPDEDSSYLSVVPLLSGYRDEETLELKLTHKYDKILADLRKQKKLDYGAYQLVIPKSKIVSCHIFDPQIYKDIRRKSEFRAMGPAEVLV